MIFPRLLITAIAIAGLAVCPAGCQQEPDRISATDHARRTSHEVSTTLKITPDDLRRKLNSNEMAKFLVSGNDIVEANLFRSGIRSIEALRGIPLRGLDLGHTHVTDLSPLEGMKLEVLVLEKVSVSDIRVIRGMPLKILKLQNTQVSDFSFLQGMALEQLNLLNLPFSDLSLVKDMPLEILWLTGTQVTDLSQIPGRRLVSLDIERTAVASVEPLASVTSLRRLNIANTQIIDVTPLQALRLERIILSPERIQTGMDLLRKMKSLVQIQTSIEQELSADEFWKRYDLGVWKPAAENSAPAEGAANESP